MSAAGPGDLLWTVGLLGYPFAERVEAAARLGYPAMSANLWELEEELDRGGVERLRELRSAADAAGVRLAVLEAVISWLPPVESAWLPRVELEKVELIGEEIGTEALLAIAYAEPLLPDAEIAAAFADLCDLAARHGWLVTLEFTPNSALKSLAAAERVVRLAARDNARIVFDTWHFFRGDPDYAVLDAIDGDLVEYVQINDAAATPVGPLTEDTKNRKLPGEGDFDLSTVLRALARAGALRSVGPEVFRPQVPQQTCLEAVAELGAATGGALARAGLGER